MAWPPAFPVWIAYYSTSIPHRRTRISKLISLLMDLIHIQQLSAMFLEGLKVGSNCLLRRRRTDSRVSAQIRAHLLSMRLIPNLHFTSPALNHGPASISSTTCTEVSTLAWTI